MEIELVSTESLIPYEFNNVKHPEAQINRIANSISEFGFNVPIIVNADNIIIAGHGRLMAAKKLGISEVPVVRKDSLTPAQGKALRILDNKLTRDSEWDFDNLGLELEMIKEEGFGLEEWGLDTLLPSGIDLSPPGDGPKEESKTLSERFLVPPFSILDARQGYWQSRKRQWLGLGIKSELGRGGGTWRESQTGGPTDRQRAYSEG
jgi:hypothetical protein